MQPTLEHRRLRQAGSVPRRIDRDSALVPQVGNLLRRHAVIDDEDLVFIAGSRVDGLGNDWSDVDVFVLTDRHVGGTAGLHILPMPHDELPLDVEVWQLSQVDELLERCTKATEALAHDHRAFMSVSEEERDFLHCLAQAIPVHNAESLLALQRRLPAHGLGSLSIARAIVGITNAQTDMMGWLECGDWQSVGTAGQKMVEFAALAALGAVDCTHPGGKWLIPLLRTWYVTVPVPPRLLRGSKTLADRAYALTIKPACEHAAHRFASDCTDFTNRAVLFAQMHGSPAQSDLMQRVLWEPPPTATDRPTCAPSLSPALQVRFHAGQWYVIRVGRDMFEMNDVAAALVMLIDGTRKADELLTALHAAGGAIVDGLQRSVHDVLLFLAHAGLLCTDAPARNHVATA